MVPLSGLTTALLASFGLASLLLALQLALLVPLSLLYGSWKRRRLAGLASFSGRVTVLVPAFNEEKTVRACVDSILASDYPDIEVVVVNDGSEDATGLAVRDLADSGRIRYLEQVNQGKASALNHGLSVATGEVVLFTDADSRFLPRTVAQMARWFSDPGIDAVCGNDAPLTADTPLRQTLAVTTHIGTGFVRRALSILGVLPIITGNLGAARTSVLRALAGFRPVWGEDLELTFRLQAARKRIVFDPDPMVLAECPATLPTLWRQRIRWARSYLKVLRMHRRLLWPTSAPPFSIYLPFNALAQVGVPLLQLASLPLFFRVALDGGRGWNEVTALLAYVGLPTFCLVALFSLALDRDWKALRYLPVAALTIVPLSYFYNFVVLASVWKEGRGESEQWNKLERAPMRERVRLGGAGLLLAGVALLALAGGARLSERTLLTPPPAGAPEGHSYPGGVELAVGTHYDAWTSWPKAVNSVVDNPAARGVRIVGVSAGRPEWTYFRWVGQDRSWSSTQRRESADVLNESLKALNARGLHGVAIVDVYAPTLIRAKSVPAAVRFDGERSAEQVEFQELVDGDYGRRVVELASYLAANYPLEGVALTELGYRSHCFDEACRSDFTRRTGRGDWPRTRSGEADREDPAVWSWRSERMEAFVQRAARAVHAAGKKLYVDVPVSWDDLKREGKDAGLDYARILRHADHIVVWNYFAMEGRPAAVSEPLARELRRRFGSDKVFVSIGLWGSSGATLEPGQLRDAVAGTVAGGMRRLWITPNHLMTPEHWRALAEALGEPRG